MPTKKYVMNVQLAENDIFSTEMELTPEQAEIVSSFINELNSESGKKSTLISVYSYGRDC